MKTLEKTMTEFVLMHKENNEWSEQYEKCLRYAKFLSTPLTLGMFIPVDEDGNVLEEPKNVNYQTDKMFDIALKRYESAISNVLFEGFEVDFDEGCVNPFIGYSYPIAYLSEDGKWVLNNFKTIEDLIPYKLKLTDNFTID